MILGVSQNILIHAIEIHKILQILNSTKVIGLELKLVNRVQCFVLRIQFRDVQLYENISIPLISTTSCITRIEYPRPLMYRYGLVFFDCHSDGEKEN